MSQTLNGNPEANAERRTPRLDVVGGGLAGCEAAWQAAERGVYVTLYEMRPKRQTPAHATDRLAELVCSNSLGSTRPDRAGGLLQAEMRRMGSLILRAAEESAVPAGGALAVDREAFAAGVTERIASHPRITLVRDEVRTVPAGPAVLATGPLTSDALATDLGALLGADYLYFFDALCPIVEADSIDMSLAFRQSRYDRGQQEEGDYINCPLNEEEFAAFHAALIAAERIELRDFEQDGEGQPFFERCLPIEVLGERGAQALAFGPMRPVGLRDPRTGQRPHAVVQLRQDNIAGSLYNLVGFQTNLKWGAQADVLRMIPGLGDAEFVRLGQMHRNTFVNSPSVLTPHLATRVRDDLFLAGQITGIEGYAGNAASGIVAGANAARRLLGQPVSAPPPETMLGALCHYVTHADGKHFQPMKANFGILPPFAPPVRNKRRRYHAYGERGLATLASWLEASSWNPAGMAIDADPAVQPSHPATSPAQAAKHVPTSDSADTADTADTVDSKMGDGPSASDPTEASPSAIAPVAPAQETA